MDFFEVQQDELEWVPTSFPRASMKVLYMIRGRRPDPAGTLRILLRDARPYLRQASDEAAQILEGGTKAGQPERGDAPFKQKGDFAFLPAGGARALSTGEEGCTISSIFHGPRRSGRMRLQTQRGVAIETGLVPLRQRCLPTPSASSRAAFSR